MKKPFYKNWWLWVIAILIILTAYFVLNDKDEKTADFTPTSAPDSATPSATEPLVLETPAPTKKTLPDYEVILKEDISFANAVRFVWNVVIKEPANVNQLQEISKILTEEAKQGPKFNSLSLAFIDYEEYMGYGYTLGGVDFAFNGDWDAAGSVDAGDYDSMKFNWKLQEKDWSKQLSHEEVIIWKDWIETLYEKSTETYIPSNEEITNIIAEKLNLDSAYVYSIVIKKANWTYDDN